MSGVRVVPFSELVAEAKRIRQFLVGSPAPPHVSTYACLLFFAAGVRESHASEEEAHRALDEMFRAIDTATAGDLS
jgi:hypothetical protein